MVAWIRGEVVEGMGRVYFGCVLKLELYNWMGDFRGVSFRVEVGFVFGCFDVGV